MIFDTTERKRRFFLLTEDKLKMTTFEILIEVYTQKRRKKSNSYASFLLELIKTEKEKVEYISLSIELYKHTKHIGSNKGDERKSFDEELVNTFKQ